MLDNMNFYKFMHKQILILIALFAGTSTSYVIFGFIYDTNKVEIVWYVLVLAVSFWGYLLHKEYADNELTIEEKENWLNRLRYFIFLYFSTWTIMFVVYVSKDNIELHYLAIFTQLGVAVVAATILVTEKKLAFFILISSMFPITVYLLLIGEFYSYIIAFLTIVLSGVLLYGSRNTYSYLQKSKFQAYHDYLTKLGNRRYFIELLEDAIKIQKHNDNYMYLLLIDLDHFKTINDTLGHDIGDLLLIEVAQRMDKVSKLHNNNVSRLGGDEFCILSHSYQDKEECLKNAISFSSDVLDVIKKTYIIDEHHLYISASIGVSVIDNPKMTANTFIKEADIAMYEAKSRGRDGLIIFNEELSVRVERKLEIESLLYFALENKEITLKYQPQLDQNSKVVGCEVLVRWTSEKLGAIYPDEFIPIAEQTGIIIELGAYILEEAFKTFSQWEKKGIYLEQLSINISMRQMFHRTFVEDVRELSHKYLSKSLRKKVVFEMTETSVAEDIDQLIKIMTRIKECGITFSMDDFGTGYSSLSYLRQIPIDELKIDKSFIIDLAEDNDKNTKMVKTILNIAKNLDLSIVAEGVETQAQKDFLIKEDCDILQGFLFAKPINKDEFEDYIKDMK
ncbi:EAL domain-containing protein [Sulfurimonas sp. MAG313]|nr:GGDEF domain-containing phosphodiesterase [Sulfurimonas sp. MAG313]MDF1881073.1 EAL domain-containing protein [Sulfurimonas sp. MAG313]